ncbi:MAG: hypothetical protein EA355_16035 [Rhodobacteraceae bacterium]|nr:MAG: hypothetical protein EA355_16035 [Paracoccaceae bacterium]
MSGAVFGLSLVVLRAADVAALAAFYGDLGVGFTWEQHGEGPRHATARLGDTVLEIYPQTAGGSSSSGARIGLIVRSIDAALTSVARPGAIIAPPEDSPWGRRCVLRDPAGHAVELAERP